MGPLTLLPLLGIALGVGRMARVSIATAFFLAVAFVILTLFVGALAGALWWTALTVHVGGVALLGLEALRHARATRRGRDSGAIGRARAALRVVLGRPRRGSIFPLRRVRALGHFLEGDARARRLLDCRYEFVPSSLSAGRTALAVPLQRVLAAVRRQSLLRALRAAACTAIDPLERRALVAARSGSSRSSRSYCSRSRTSGSA